MGPFVLAWMVAEGIIIYRSAKIQKAPPGPGQLLFSSGLFVMLALLAEAPKARPLATTLAWGFVIAAYMHLFDKQSGTSTKGGTWPPGLAPGNVVIPSGTSSGNTSPTPGNTTGPTPV